MPERHEVDDDDDTLPFVRTSPVPPRPSPAPTRVRGRGASGATVVLAASDSLWDASDVASYLKVSRSWVYHRAEAGLLPCFHVGGLLLFDPQAIRTFLQRR